MTWSRSELRTRVLRYDPRRLLLQRVAVIVLAIAIGAGLYLLGHARGAGAARTVLSDLSDTRAELRASEQQRGVLEDRVAMLEKGGEVDRAAAVRLREDYSAAREQVARLEQEATLYESLLDGTMRASGLALQQWELHPGAREDAFEFRVTLVQRLQKPQTLNGRLSIDVTGMQAGEERTLDLGELGMPESDEGIPLAFRYFQVVEGEMTLPPGFSPQRVTIRVRTGNARAPRRLDQTLPWQPTTKEQDT